MADPGQQPVEVVDADGTVLSVVRRSEMRADNLRHRCTYVAVVVGQPPDSVINRSPSDRDRPLRFDHDTELWVHQRADWKDTNPSFWDLAFGGVCDVGEPWQAAAERELAEEAGVTGVPLVELGSCRYEDSITRVVGRVYLTWWPDEPACPDGEVVAVDRVRLGLLEEWLDNHPVCRDSATVVPPVLPW